MLIHTKELLEFEEPIIAINPRFEKLTTSLRTAISDEVENLVENLSGVVPGVQIDACIQ